MVKDRGSRRNAPDVLEQEATARRQVTAMSKREFLEQYPKLAKHFSADAGQPRLLRVRGLQALRELHVLPRLRQLLPVHPLHPLRAVQQLLALRGLKSCHACAYCVQSENCTTSAYLVLCRNLSDCNYCFGCVGLVQEGLPHPQRALPPHRVLQAGEAAAQGAGHL